MLPPRPNSGARQILTIALASGIFALSAAGNAAAAVVPAPSASSYRESVGVQLHTNFVGFATDTEPAATIESAISGLGIRHVRDGVCLDKEEVCAGVRTKLGAIGTDTYGPSGPRVGLMVNVMPNADKPTLRADRDAEIARGLRGLRDSPLALSRRGHRDGQRARSGQGQLGPADDRRCQDPQCAPGHAGVREPTEHPGARSGARPPDDDLRAHEGRLEGRVRRCAEHAPVPGHVHDA